MDDAPQSAKPNHWNRPACGIENCRSKQYHEEDGLIFCSNGHQQYVRLWLVDTCCCSSNLLGYTSHNGRRGWVQRNAGAKVTPTEREIRTIGPEYAFSLFGLILPLQIKSVLINGQDYTSFEALELYLKAYQLILRKQCWVLVHDLRLPGDLESVVKDLWELRLMLLQGRLTAIEKENALFGSHDISGSEATSKSQKRLDLQGKMTPKILESLALCYMAILILRVPISLGDLYQ